MKGIEKAIGKLAVWLKNWSMPIFIVLFLYLAVILVWVWRSSEQGPELAKFLGYLIGGVLLIVQIFVSNRRATAAEETAKAMQETAKSTEKGNIAERFKNAIEHLGNGSASVRLGGIYALHHIVQEVEDYQKRVFQILCAHIRETTTHAEYKPRNADNIKIQPTIEIQSILNLLFNETQGKEIYKGLRGNLEGADLRGARLEKANLQNAILQDASLQRAFLVGADLQRSYLWNANLQNSRLWDANLQNAHLPNANLQDTHLFNANLQNAHLTVANLQDSRLWDTNLQDAHLLKANLQNARLWGANLQNADLSEANLQNTDLRNVEKLEVEQLLKAKTLYKAKLPDEMKKKIEQKRPDLFEDPKAKQES